MVLVRHGQSEGNLRNIFTGWTDVGLSEQGLPLAQTAVIVSYAFVFSLVINDIVKLAILTRVRPFKHLLR